MELLYPCLANRIIELTYPKGWDKGLEGLANAGELAQARIKSLIVTKESVRDNET